MLKKYLKSSLKGMTFLMMLLATVEAKSQYSVEGFDDVQFQKVYSYEVVHMLDSENNTMFTSEIQGLICFQVYEGAEYISITAENDDAEVYSILKSKIEYTDNSKVHVFLGKKEGQEQITLVQFFEIYNL